MALRRLLTVVCLLPMLVLLARHAPYLERDPLAVGYGMTVLAGTIGLLYIAYSRYDDPAERALLHCPPHANFPALGELPRVSLLLAVRDEVETIAVCVASMANSHYPQLEIIIVDDASEDGTTKALRDLRDEFGFTLVELDQNVGKKRALIQGAALAGGEVLAFTDSDCVLAPDALTRCVRALSRHPELGAVSGHARALNPTASFLTRIQDVWYEGQFRVMKAAEAAYGAVTCVSGPLAVFRRDAIYNYLPAWADDRFLGREFRMATDRQLTGYVLGQLYVGRRLKDAHASSPFVTATDYPERTWQVGYVRSAKVWTNVPVTARAMFSQQVRWKKSFIRSLCFVGRFMWRRGPVPSLLYYGHVLWALAAPAMAIRHLVWAPMQGMWQLTALYIGGIALKGTVFGIAYRIDHPGDSRWRYRPLMSLLSALALSWLLVFSLATIRRSTWARGSSRPQPGRRRRLGRAVTRSASRAALLGGTVAAMYVLILTWGAATVSLVVAAAVRAAP